MNKITQVQNGFVWGNQVIPVFDDQLLPVFRAAAISSDILVRKCVSEIIQASKAISRVLSVTILLLYSSTRN